MRNLLLAFVCIALLGLTAWLSARTANANVKIQLRLVDAETGKGMAGIVRVFPDGENKPLVLTGLFDRIRGLENSENLKGWYVVPSKGADVNLPKGQLRLEALAGLETALATQQVNLDEAGAVTVKVTKLFRPEDRRLAAGNTHLHLRNLSREDSDEYLRQIPAADGLKVMFISNLERVKDDEQYITNRYPVGDLKEFAATGVLFNNGEEHRHNFTAHGQGYGHVMLLDLQRLAKPVSLGPGLTGAGFDDRPLRLGIDDARKQGGTVIWCHNTNGFEDVPNALANRLDALNVFDGSRTGSYEENYYRYLNIGIPMPISTGTDWFIYDFSRVYARVQGALSVKGWLEAVKAGRCVATNGPLLALKVDDIDIGDTLNLEKAGSLRIEATGIGRHDFQDLELVHNGKVIATRQAAKKGAGYHALLKVEIKVDGPGWFAVRINAKTKNELDKQLYAHSSPVYVTLGGKKIFDLDSAQALLKQLEEGRAEIRARGQFSGDQARDELLALYDHAIKDLTKRINQRG